jgi:hypothetical protein
MIAKSLNFKILDQKHDQMPFLWMRRQIIWFLVQNLENSVFQKFLDLQLRFLHFAKTKLQIEKFLGNTIFEVLDQNPVHASVLVIRQRMKLFLAQKLGKKFFSPKL